MSAHRILAVAALLAVLAGCPPSKPPPVRPDADAALPIAHANCGAAARHYAGVCATADEATVSILCGSIVRNLPGYADCLAAAGSCDDGTACDHRDQAQPAKPVVNGR